MEEEEIFEVSDSDEIGDVIVVLSEASSESSEKKRKRDQRLDEVARQYEFMQEEVIDLVSDNDEEDMRDFVQEDDVDANALMLQHGLVNDERADLREAFTVLDAGDWQQFLRLPVINNKLAPAFILLEHFGIGKGTETVKRLWRLMWQQKFVISDSKMIVEDEKCLACVNERSCGYACFESELSYGEGDLELIGFMGAKCYEIRFRPLRSLVEHCRLLPACLADGDFDQLVEEHLNDDLGEIVHANKAMEKAHRHLKPKSAAHR